MAASAPFVPEGTDGTRVVIEESDLYQTDGDLLFVQNARTGLNVVSLADPAAPVLLGRAPVTGEAGELYLHRRHAAILFKSAGSECRPLTGQTPWAMAAGSELAVVKVRRPRRPTVVARHCLPGELVASRLVGDFLVVATNDVWGNGAQLLSIDLRDPGWPSAVAALGFPGASREIHVTPHAIFVAAPRGFETRVRYVEISAETGAIRARGEVTVPGQPQGRFHMDEHDGYFRIVTFDPNARHSRLSVIDALEPDRLEVVGSLAGLGSGERLFATRFDGERAYVVTFRQVDPLWAIDLSDPAKPALKGELHVPGWSDFLFPRGDRLVAVGRGDRGAGVQVSLFDVSDLSRPRALTQLQLGGAAAQSEANTDHRAVSVLEPPGGAPVVVVSWESCGATGALQIIDLEPWGLRARGALPHADVVRRTLLAGPKLVGISERRVVSLDISDRDRPLVRGEVALADGEPETGSRCFADLHRPSQLLCQGGPAGLPLAALLAAAAALLARRVRRRRRV
jgi:hypothetical protein